MPTGPLLYQLLQPNAIPNIGERNQRVAAQPMEQVELQQLQPEPQQLHPEVQQLQPELQPLQPQQGQQVDQVQEAQREVQVRVEQEVPESEYFSMLHIDEDGRISKILLEGEESEIKNVNMRQLLSAMYELRDTKVHLRCLPQIWKVIKNQIELKNVSVLILKLWKNYYEYISEKDFFDLSERDDIESKLLGEYEDLTKKKAVIVMSSLLHKHDVDFFLDHNNLNKLYTLLCGIPRTILFKIPPEEYAEISGKIFKKLNSCSLARLRTLLLLMMRSTVHGPPQVWNDTIVEKLNLLLLALEADELTSIPPAALQKISPSVLEQMNIKLIRTLSQEQVLKLNFPAFLAYKKRFFFTSGQKYTNTVNFHFNVTVLIILVFLK